MQYAWMMFSASRMLRSHLLLGDSADTTPTTVDRAVCICHSMLSKFVSISVPNLTLLSINRRCLHIHCEDVFDVHVWCVAHVFIIGVTPPCGLIGQFPHCPPLLPLWSTPAPGRQFLVYMLGRSLASRQQQSDSCSCSRRKTSWDSFMVLFRMDTVWPQHHTGGNSRHCSECHKIGWHFNRGFLCNEIILLGVSISPTEFPTLPTLIWGAITPFFATITRQKLIKCGHLWRGVLTSFRIIQGRRCFFDWRIHPVVISVPNIFNRSVYLTVIICLQNDLLSGADSHVWVLSSDDISPPLMRSWTSSAVLNFSTSLRPLCWM